MSPGARHASCACALSTTVVPAALPDARAASHSPAPCMAEKKLCIVHFNDVYNIEAREQEPVGGAAKFVQKCRQLMQACDLLYCGFLFMCLHSRCWPANIEPGQGVMKERRAPVPSKALNLRRICSLTARVLLRSGIQRPGSILRRRVQPLADVHSYQRGADAAGSQPSWSASCRCWQP
jgi:hypothetical protein